MSTTKTCGTCGAALSAGTVGSHCPACVLRAALTADDSTVDDTSEVAQVFPAPFGSYELLAEIGRGGMGLVFKARQPNLDRIVALKVLLTGKYSDETTRRRFRLEAESAAKLQHPNIVAIHDVGEVDGQPYLTMDFVEGPNLAELCDGHPLPARIAATHLRDIARAVHVAHLAGVLHRDLKPSNILMGEDHRPRVTDFGMAKRFDLDGGVTLTGQMLGSPNYAPPEQARGDTGNINAASDVYGLGALLYHLVTGRAPFSAATPAETLRLVLETEPPSPRMLNPSLPRDLETICLKCLQKDPARRYASAEALADELDRFLSLRPIIARPASRAEVAWRWCRRHPAAASLAATVAIALVATSAIFYASARRIEHARALQEDALLEAQKGFYAAHMQSISSSFSSVTGFTDLNDIMEMFSTNRPTSREHDWRGFEWRYFWLKARSDARGAFKNHRQVVDAACFSGDGARVATHSLDGTLKIWDAAGLHEIHSVEGVAALGGFNADGTQVIFSRRDNSVWRVELGSRETTQVLAASGRLIAARPDGRHVVVFGPERLPVLRDLGESGASPADKFPDVPLETCAVVSSDGRRAAVAGPQYPGILVIDLATGKQIAALVDPRPVIALALSPNGAQLVSGGFDGVHKVWDVDRGVQVHAFKPFLDPSWGMAYSADGKLFATGGHNRVVELFATSTWETVEDLRGHQSTIRCIAFAPDGNHLVSGAEDELALIWPTQIKRLQQEMPRLLRGPQWIDRTPSLAFSPDSRFFAGTAADGTIKVWTTDSIETRATLPMEARTVAFSPDGLSVVGEGVDGGVQRWTLDGRRLGEPVRAKARFANWQVDPLSPQERVSIVAEQPDARAICRTCEIPSARDGINAGAMMTTPTIAMSPDGQTMFVGTPQGSVEVWNVSSRQRLFVFQAHKLSVTAIAASPDGQYIATGGLDNATQLWTAATGEHVATFHAHNRPVWALAFSPDGKTLASGSCDKSVILCSIPLKRHVASLPLYVGLPKGYEQEVRLLRFSPDGNILAAALGDGTVRFFRAASFAETDRL